MIQGIAKGMASKIKPESAADRPQLQKRAPQTPIEKAGVTECPFQVPVTKRFQYVGRRNWWQRGYQTCTSKPSRIRDRSLYAVWNIPAGLPAVIDRLLVGGKRFVIPSSSTLKRGELRKAVLQALRLIKKQFCAIATRYNKTARSFLAAIHLAMLSFGSIETGPKW